MEYWYALSMSAYRCMREAAISSSGLQRGVSVVGGLSAVADSGGFHWFLWKPLLYA